MAADRDLADGRKNLFDALRMPHNRQELPRSAAAGFCYCLLEDDSRITGVQTEIERWLEPKLPDEPDSTVLLSVGVEVKAGYPMIGNLGW